MTHRIIREFQNEGTTEVVDEYQDDEEGRKEALTRLKDLHEDDLGQIGEPNPTLHYIESKRPIPEMVYRQDDGDPFLVMSNGFVATPWSFDTATVRSAPNRVKYDKDRPFIMLMDWQKSRWAKAVRPSGWSL